MGLVEKAHEQRQKNKRRKAMKVLKLVSRTEFMNTSKLHSLAAAKGIYGVKSHYGTKKALELLAEDNLVEWHREGKNNAIFWRRVDDSK